MKRRLRGRCYLCGAHTGGDYCYAHAWADTRTNNVSRDELARAAVYRQGFREGRSSINGTVRA